MDYLVNAPPIVRFFFLAMAAGAAFAVVLSMLASKKGQVDQDKEKKPTGKESFPTVLQTINKLPLSAQQRIETAQAIAKVLDTEVSRKADELKQAVSQKYEKIIQEKDEGIKKATEHYKVVEKQYDTLNQNFKKMDLEKKQTEAVVHSMAEGVIVVNHTGEILLMNPAAEKLLGVKKEEEIGKPILQEQKENRLISFVKDISGTEEKEVHLSSQSDETKRILRTSNAVIESQDGTTLGMVAVLSDVTRAKELEEMKTKFVSSVSHELRTPLYTVQETINLLLDRTMGEISPKQEGVLSTAKVEIQRLGRLINDLLDIAKIESGRFQLNPSLFSVNELVRVVVGNFQLWTKNKQITLETRLGSDSLVLEGDQDRLNQVLTNLVGNAFKFTPAGGKVAVQVRKISRPDTAHGEWLEFCVEDTGPGVPQKDRNRIFEKFVQLGPSSMAGMGTGLGLSISKEIIELHGGKIWVESEEGRGSRFIFQVPQHTNSKP